MENDEFYPADEDFDEDEIEEIDPDEEENFDCGMIFDLSGMAQGCQKAGSEECDFECPFREEFEEEAEMGVELRQPQKKSQFKAFIDAEQKDYFDFVCEGCGAEGEIAIPRDLGMKTFGCPDGCGATYVRWTPPNQTPELKCVVWPVRK